MPNGLDSIGDYAFQNCNKLTSVSLPASLDFIGDFAFTFNHSLASFTVDNSNSYFSSIDGVLFDKSKSTIIYFPGGKSISYKIPETVKTIGLGAFMGNDILSDISISAENISQVSFWNCTNLKSVTLSSSIKIIGDASFENCTALNSIYCLGSTPIDLSSSIDVFNKVDKSNCILYVPTGSITAYHTANQWKEFNTITETTTSLSRIVDKHRSISPSIVSDGFTIKGINDHALISIYNLKSNLILSKLVNTNEYITVSGLSAGVYIVNVKELNSIDKVLKFIKL